jgi:hypothetical protein
MLPETMDIAAATILLMAILAGIANQRYRGVQRLPVHWGITGRVDGFAPRWFALSFIPVMAGTTFIFINVLKGGSPSARIPELGAAFTFVGVQVLHFALIRGTLRRQP